MRSAKDAGKPEECLLVKTASEISLKSPPVRAFFMRKLADNIKAALKKKGLTGIEMRSAGGRLFLHGARLADVQDVISDIFGVHSSALCLHYKVAGVGEIADAAVDYFAPAMKKQRKPIAGKHKKSITFAVRANRTGQHEFSSRDIEKAAGERLLAAVPSAKVNLTKPGFVAHMEVRDGDVYCYVEEEPGLGGLPLGVEGCIGFLFSGREHESAAAFLLMRRGCCIYPIIEKPGGKADANIKKLVRFNSLREFKKTALSGLGAAVAEHNLLALGSADTEPCAEGNAKACDAGTAKAAGASAASADARALQHGIPVLRPLVLYPEEMLREKETLIGGG